jgi:hypothetical protein
VTYRLLSEPDTLLSYVFRTSAWHLEKMVGGLVEKIPSQWDNPMIYWTADQDELKIIYSSGFHGEALRFRFSEARGDTLVGLAEEVTDQPPASSPPARITAVRRQCPR